MRKRRVRQFEFLTGYSPEWFFHSWYTPKEHVFRDPNTFSNLHEAFSSVSRFVLIQRWTALIQRKPALNSSETALISAEIHKISETALFSADLLWDFNPGLYNPRKPAMNVLRLTAGPILGVLYLLLQKLFWNSSSWDIYNFIILFGRENLFAKIIIWIVRTARLITAVLTALRTLMSNMTSKSFTSLFPSCIVVYP